MLKELVSSPEVQQFYVDGITYMIFEDKTGMQHIEPDYRVYEADLENPGGHEYRLHQEITDPLE